MKILILKISLLLIPILVGAIVIEFETRSIPNDYSYKNDYLENNAQNINILILGSSHSFFGINPEFFSLPAFNAAAVSQTLDYDSFIFNKFKDKLKNLKAVVVPISYFSLFFRIGEGEESWRVKNYSIYYDCQFNVPLKDHFEVLSGNISTLIRRIYKYKFTSDYTNITCSKLGFGLKYSEAPKNDLVEEGRQSALSHEKISVDNIKYNIAILEDMIKYCKEKNIKVILFTPPAWHTYRDNLDEKRLKEIYKTCINLTKEYRNCFYYNLLDDERFILGDFHDADHLNHVGAEKLTKILEGIIKDPT